MEFFFFIPYSVIFIILFIVMGFGMIGIDFLAGIIIKWQYVILAIMLIVALISNIVMVVQSYVNIVLKTVHCLISTFLDSIKQTASIVLIMVFSLEIINDIHKQAMFMLIFGFIYIFFFLLIVTVVLLVCFGINIITETLLDKMKNETGAFIISLILNVILTVTYLLICVYLISADSSEYKILFGKSIINNIAQKGYNVIVHFSHYFK